MPNPTKQLENFLDREWSKRDHSFQGALREVIRYSQFLEVIKARVESASKEYIRLVQIDMSIEHSYEILTEDDKERVDTLVHSALLVQLEIETFFLFSKIYLDMTARFLGVYFGQHARFRFESFEKLFQRDAAIWKSNYELNFDPEFPKVIQELLGKIVHFRGKKIVHPKGRDAQSLIGRRTHALAFKLDGSNVSLTVGLVGAKSADEFYQSTDVRDLWKLIGHYTTMFIEFAGRNVENVGGSSKGENLQRIISQDFRPGILG